MLNYFNSYVLRPLLERRSGRDIFSKFAELQKFAKLDNQAQLQFQRQNLVKVLEFCKVHVPYYRDVMAQRSFVIDKVAQDIRYLQELPVLTKELVREHATGMRQPTAYHVRKTGGSTGSSVFFYYDNPGMDWTAAINLQAYEMAGKKPHYRECHISAELDLHPPTLKGKIMDHLSLRVHNRRRLMVHSFSDENLRIVFHQLKKMRPFLLQGHPSSAYAVANYLESHKIKAPKLCHVFEPSGEALNPKMVEKIETQLGCKVVNRYGNAEFGVIAHSRLQDPYQKLQVFRRAFYVEPVTAGPLIVSNWTNMGFPLLRYDTGDVGTVREEVDGCFIYDIQGRIHDLVTINGEPFPTHYIMDFLDHKVKGVREFQVVLHENRHPQLNLVAESDNDRERIRSEIQLRWPQGLEVQFVAYDQLQTVGWRQKFRHVLDLRAQHSAKNDFTNASID